MKIFYVFLILALCMTAGPLIIWLGWGAAVLYASLFVVFRGWRLIASLVLFWIANSIDSQPFED